MYENEKICTECGGSCCKTMPGACYPSDFGLPGSFKKLDDALVTGRYCVDWWEGDPREGETELEDYECYYIRPATKNKVGVRYDPSWGGECTFLTTTGCELNPDDRPLNCKKLEPKPNGNCVLHDNVGKRDAVIAWLPYQEHFCRN